LSSNGGGRSNEYLADVGAPAAAAFPESVSVSLKDQQEFPQNSTPFRHIEVATTPRCRPTTHRKDCDEETFPNVSNMQKRRSVFEFKKEIPD